MGFEVGDVEKLEAQYEKLNNQLIKLRKNKEQFDKKGFSESKKSVNDVNKGMT